MLNAGTGAVVQTLTGTLHRHASPPAPPPPPVDLGTWTAANGRYTVRVVLADDANELPVKRANNTSERPLFVGRGANMPYDMYEAEDGNGRWRRPGRRTEPRQSATSPVRPPAAGRSR